MRTRRYILFLIVGLLTFLMGVAVAGIFGGFRTREVKRTPCGYHSSLMANPPAPPLEPLAPPPPPAIAEVGPTTAELRTNHNNQARTSSNETRRNAQATIVERVGETESPSQSAAR